MENSSEAAVQSFLEELEFFPLNHNAIALLAELDSQQDPSSYDEEFVSIYRQVKPHTMVGVERLYSLFCLSKQVLLEDIPGDFVECGVARGGTSLLFGMMLKKYSKRERKLYSFDTFDGMPAPSNLDKHQGMDAEATGWGKGTCLGTLDNFNKKISDFGLDGIVKPIVGLFEDNLPEYKNCIPHVSLLHMDGDWYSSTKAILTNLYANVSANGVIQIDDYGFWSGCKKAVDEFMVEQNIKSEIHFIDSSGIWLNKLV